VRVSRPPAPHGDGGIQVALTTRDGRRVCAAVSDDPPVTQRHEQIPRPGLVRRPSPHAQIRGIALDHAPSGACFILDNLLIETRDETLLPVVRRAAILFECSSSPRPMRMQPRHLQPRGRVVGRHRAASAISLDHRQREGAGTRPDNRRMEAATVSTMHGDPAAARCARE
jgi:hypothetical protein